MKKVERVWLVGMAYFMPMVILYYIPFIISNFKAYLIGTIAGLLMMYLLERKIFSCILIINIIIIL